VSSTLHGRRTTRGELGRCSPWSCSRRRRRPDSNGRGARTATVGFRPGDGVFRTCKVRQLGERRARGRGRETGGAGEVSCRDARRAVPTAALNRGIGAAPGGHTATARCRVGPALHVASDRWGPLVSDFRIKNHLEGK
jgi:hypothetical protein